MTVTVAEDVFKETNQIRFKCPAGHESTMAAASFINKTSPKNVSKLKSICADCNTILIVTEEARDITEKLGFEFLSIERHATNKDSKVVRYRCLCGNESSTDLRNLKKSDRQSQCAKCQNNNHRIDYTVLYKNFQDRHCTLLTPREEYRNNKQKLEFKCACGAIDSIVHQDLMRGRLCASCKEDRTKVTCVERYGVDNPSKNHVVKKKIVDTMMKNHGVEYAQQKPEIRAKTDATSLEKYGKLRAFLLPEVFDKIRKTHKVKYGVEFPLQAKEIQDKITMTFMKTLNAPRPFLSDIYLQRMKEKYGHEWFCCTDAFKEVMVEKYGSEYFITSQKYREIMLEKYGAESAMQCPELFRKAQSSSFCRKPYISPDGKTFMVLGYEGIAMDDILKKEGIKTFYAGEDKEIPVFQYIGDDDKTHSYYPDVYIPEENRVIEIKSVYTYNRDPEKTLCKALKVSESHLFELRLYNSHKEVVEILECRNGMFYSKTLGHLQPGFHYT